MQISEELPVGHLHYGKWTEDRRRKTEAIWNADKADPFRKRRFKRILKVIITQSFIENTQRFTEKKYFKPLGTIVPERFYVKYV